MRNQTDILEVMPSLIGTMGVIGATAIGAPVCVQGFRDVLAVLVAGALYGTGDGTATTTLTVKMQQSASATGTGTGWSDITPGDVNGTFAFSALTFGLTTTTPNIYVSKKYERIGSGITGKYIRAHATLAGTAGLSPKFCVTFLLGKPVDTLYVAGPSAVATGNSEFALLR